MIKLSSIKPNESNPRYIQDGKLDQLVKSITDFPKMMSLRPITVDEDNIILGGNMRYHGLLKLGYTEIPDDWLQVAEGLTDEQKREFIIKDNVGFGSWSWDVLANEWDSEQLAEWGLDIPGWDEAEEIEAKEDDYEEPDQIQVDVVLGDLITFEKDGKELHRVLCGDSTDSDAVERLMCGQVSELLFTSPPYSDMRDYEGGKDVSVDNLIEFIPTFLPYANYQVINLGLQRKNHEVVEYWKPYIETAKDCGYKFLSWNVWDKMQGGSIASATAMFMQTHEWIFVFGKDFKMINRTIPNQLEKYAARYGENWQDGIQSKGIRQKDGSMSATKSKTYTHHQMHSVIQQTPELGPIRNSHPATFPIGLPFSYIEAMTSESDIVCEPFTGSFTTMVAAHQLNRKCYGMELEPRYCQVGIDRMTKLDPELVVKINGKEYTKSQ